MKRTLKDWRKVYNRVKRVGGFDEHEKKLCARSLAATLDERWPLNVTFLRALGLWGARVGKNGHWKVQRIYGTCIKSRAR
jgi:hypothetical protein